MADLTSFDGAGAGGAAGVLAILISKLIDKLPMFKKNKTGVSSTDMRLAISEHKIVCIQDINSRFDEVKEHISKKNDELFDRILKVVTKK